MPNCILNIGIPHGTTCMWRLGTGEYNKLICMEWDENAWSIRTAKNQFRFENDEHMKIMKFHQMMSDWEMVADKMQPWPWPSYECTLYSVHMPIMHFIYVIHTNIMSFIPIFLLFLLIYGILWMIWSVCTSGDCGFFFFLIKYRDGYENR